MSGKTVRTRIKQILSSLAGRRGEVEIIRDNYQRHQDAFWENFTREEFKIYFKMLLKPDPATWLPEEQAVDAKMKALGYDQLTQEYKAAWPHDYDHLSDAQLQKHASAMVRAISTIIAIDEHNFGLIPSNKEN